VRHFSDRFGHHAQLEQLERRQQQLQQRHVVVQLVHV
jgi:hypothetical protein